MENKTVLKLDRLQKNNESNCLTKDKIAGTQSANFI